MFADMSLNFKHTVYDTFAQFQDIVLLTNSYRLLTTFWCIALRWAVNNNLDLEVK